MLTEKAFCLPLVFRKKEKRKKRKVEPIVSLVLHRGPGRWVGFLPRRCRSSSHLTALLLNVPSFHSPVFPWRCLSEKTKKDSIREANNRKSSGAMLKMLWPSSCPCKQLLWTGVHSGARAQRRLELSRRS